MKEKKNIIHKSIDTIDEFLAGDHTLLKEILHPANDNLALPYSIAYARLEAGTQSLPHALNSTEVYIFLQGKGTVSIGQTKKEIQQGELIVVPPAENQYVRNTGTEDLVFLCIVSPSWKRTDEIIFDK